MATSSNGEGIKVLLIDGHDDARSWVEQLQRFGHIVHRAASGEGGLKLFRAQQFDCVVTDLALPKMTGYEVLSALATLAMEPAPVLILTRIDSPILRDLAMKNGARAYLVKSRASVEDIHNAILAAIASDAAPGSDQPDKESS